VWPPSMRGLLTPLNLSGRLARHRRQALTTSENFPQRWAHGPVDVNDRASRAMTSRGMNGSPMPLVFLPDVEALFLWGDEPATRIFPRSHTTAKRGPCRLRRLTVFAR
jgi:hypothetical protein